MLVERDLDVVSAVVLEVDARIGVGFTRHSRRKQRHVTFSWCDSEALTIRPGFDFVNIPLKARLEVGDDDGRLEDVEVVSIRIAERSAGREVRDNKIEQDRSENTTLRDAGVDDTPWRKDALVEDATLSSAQVCGDPTLEI